MLTSEQETWLAHLSDKDRISIFPFDPTAEAKFQQVKETIQGILGNDIPVEHHGASSLGISGQDEIDIYVPMPPSRFYELFEALKNIFNEPRSFYPLQRCRFVTELDGKHIDIFLVNRDHPNWQNSVKFESYLRSHPEELEDYRLLKESGDGLTVQEYYRRKGEFINEILSRTV